MKISSGVDLIEVNRVSEAINKWKDRFLRRLFTDSEIRYSAGKKFYNQHLAARFAAKEAVLKAFGIGWSRFVKWKDVEILNKKNGKPQIRLHGYLKTLKKEKKIKDIAVSISHTKDYAIANCVLLRND
jgi:holo-[acyl-carrier protein] synthase